jgi:predicted transposase YdaD
VTAKPYDPTLKTLVETDPESWPGLCGQPTGPTQVIDADIATISGAADKVLCVCADTPYLLHLEFVAGHDSAALPRKLHLRNALLEDRHDIRVRSVAVLLRPEADSPQLTELYERRFPGEEEYLKFRYHVLRVWELAPELLLNGPLGQLPLAVISAVTEEQLPGIIKRMEQRLSSRRARRQAPKLWAAAYILLGLRYSAPLAAQLFQGVVSMKESATYQAIIEEGRKEGRKEGAVAAMKKVLRRQGDKAFGPPNERTAAAIEQINDRARLEEMLDRVLTAKSWQDVVGQPASGRRGGQRKAP